MNTKYFNHPNLINKTHLFLDLYYQYYDLLKLRSNIRREYSKCFEYGDMQDPVLIGELECDLQVLEKEEIDLLNDTKLELDEKTPKLKQIDKERNKIFKKLDKHGINAWCGFKIEPDFEPDDGRKHKVQLRYLNHKIEKLKKQIEELRKDTTVKDPFFYLEEKYLLTEDELEILIFLYFNNFDDAEPIRGDLLLFIIIGKQRNLFNAQSLLFDKSGVDISNDDLSKVLPETKCLIENDLIQKVESGFDALSSTFAISRYANLIISDLHAELPHLDVKFNLKTKKRGEK